jgi:hypothetical protein
VPFVSSKTSPHFGQYMEEDSSNCRFIQEGCSTSLRECGDQLGSFKRSREKEQPQILPLRVRMTAPGGVETGNCEWSGLWATGKFLPQFVVTFLARFALNLR